MFLKTLASYITEYFVPYCGFSTDKDFCEFINDKLRKGDNPSKKLSFDDLKKYEDYINDNSRDNRVNVIQFIKRFNDEEYWREISNYCSLTILTEFEDKINWIGASFNKNLSVDLIRRHRKEVSWFPIMSRSSIKTFVEFEEDILEKEIPIIFTRHPEIYNFIKTRNNSKFNHTMHGPEIATEFCRKPTV